ncbi:DUF2934 domain-containing protein [Mesorhizobium sp. B2-1-3A]|nr:DUF2934 domain-containing protein [Mesorhizobium sp. B2-1-3A]
MRARAYRLWDEAGQPDGRHDDHWEQAVREIKAEDNQQKGDGMAAGSETGIATDLQPAAPFLPIFPAR